MHSVVSKPAIATMALKRFRNYEEARIALSPRLNLIWGANGQGKSNLLEAIYLLASTRSFRGATSNELVLHGADAAEVSAVLSGSEQEIGIILPTRGRRTARVGATNLPRVQDLIGRIPSVCFSSLDMVLVAGEPNDRRRFLDNDLSQISPGYLAAILDYRRLLKQRNAAVKALREGGNGRHDLEAWNHRMAPSAARVRRLRMEYVAALSPFAREEHSRLSAGAEDLVVRYGPSDDCVEEQDFVDAFRTSFHRDLALGATTVGPHRDDVILELGGRSAAKFGSQGQQRTAVLAVKLAQVQHCIREVGVVPLVLLDDILSDLDSSRRHQVLEGAALYGQVVITCTDYHAVESDFSEPPARYKIDAGRVIET